MIAKAGYSPLYRRVEDIMRTRLTDGSWPPGHKLPSEQALAGEFGVAQGTLRKAVETLAAEGLIERRQGKGSFARQPQVARPMFQFFFLARPGGERLTPDLRRTSVEDGTADEAEAARLHLDPGAPVVRMFRERSLEGQVVLVERIVLPGHRFAGIGNLRLPQALYAMYQSEFRVMVTAVHEELRSIAADAEQAGLLEVAPGFPLLAVDRIAYDLEGTPVEWRVSACNTQDLVYSVTLR
ncbi:GntR family transcriptional regulator [Stappia sp. 28M-7]|uniref:GntR family transcriptional regulator n=1 Tax=Stappia sp. 28M-7 TaxID=2762596 RepID=UPI00163C8FF1|nr:GntR family transcriptional regulator [Stappia sp. 28M-7]MBC2859044.1 GntR family transcriptional regulator [Stappia sp. 28M-7]